MVSVNGEYGVVTVYGSGISRSSTNAQTIDAALTALENNVSNNSDAITELTNITDTLAIVANGDTHPQIANGQFVIVKNHSTLPDGVYKATAAIQTDGALSTRNLQADGAGGLNNLQSQVDSLNSNKVNVSDIVNNLTSTAINKPLSAAQGKALKDDLWKQYGTNFTGDANTLVDNGTGYCNGASNTPTGAGNGIIIVFRASDVITLQLYLPYNSTTIYRRLTNNSGGTWTAWA